MSTNEVISERVLPVGVERFNFEQMEVFRLALRVADMAEDLARAQRRERPWVSNQIGRAGLSTMNNTAEALGEKSPGDKARLFRYAARSAVETAAMVVFLGRRGLITSEREVEARNVILAAIKPLTRMAIHFQRRAR